MTKKRIKFYQSFEELEADDLQMKIDSTLQERWDTFWALRKFHYEFFGKPEEPASDGGKKRVIFSKPEWI